jgi:hypothetical protein
MAPKVQRLLDTIWELEQITENDLRTTEQEILGRAVTSGMIDSNSTLGKVGDGYLALIERTTHRIIETVERTLKAHAAIPDEAACQQLLSQIDERIGAWISSANSKIAELRQRGPYDHF